MERTEKPLVIPGLYHPTDSDRETFSRMSVCILTPVQGYDVAGKFAKSVANLISYSWMHGLAVYQMGITERMVVDWARNELARLAKDKVNEYTGKQFTHLLWLDDDHVFHPDMLVKLAAHDKDMVSALYYARVGKPLPVVYVKDHGSKEDLKHFPLIVTPNALFECDAAGFGAMLMRRDVLDRVPQPWFTIDYRGGEDIAFCVKAKQHGVGIYCDGQYKLGHISAPGIVTHGDYDRYMKEHGDEFSDKVQVTLGA